MIPSIGIRILRFFKKNRGYFKIGGINFYLDFLDPIDRQIILNKKYENDQVVFIEREMEKNLFEYFLDIGANSGYYSFFFANKFKNLKVKAYEPNFDAFNKFKKTLNKNSFKNIEVFNFGLSDQEKKVKMYSLITHNYTHSNSTISKNLNDVDIENYNIFEALLKLGDNQFNFYEKKLLIKIDVEGHEIETLKGLIKNLLNNKCLILIEISNKKFSEVNRYLVKNSFKQIFKSKYRSDYVYTNF
jgi:FkbM family methyltransferase|tara:strand:- start:18 stop:749 length:732 start_codon:yes stop_codon:yes gene_type:complete